MIVREAAGVVPGDVTDPINRRILAVSEDQVRGFVRDPLGEIAHRSGVEPDAVLARIRAMLRAGTVRRVRQTLVANNLADGALVAWRVPPERLDAAFDFLLRADPFTGHVVARTTEPSAPGASYRLWTTLKVPQGYSLEKHARYLQPKLHASGVRLMPARYVFVLGVGHVRRDGLAIGSKADVAPEPLRVRPVELNDDAWRVLRALKREFGAEELGADLWSARAAEAGLSLEAFCRAAEELDRRGLVGRFSTFLEHVKPHRDGARVTGVNALFHWAVPPGRELEAGREVGRHRVLTHAYWRDGGEEFGNVNIMAVAHGADRATALAHKGSIDDHLASVGIPVTFSNVFWGERSEIKPSEICPLAYAEWCGRVGLEPESMRIEPELVRAG
ncbi:MAG: Lrp/AsnC family transcriptional regulator [Planctomycetes bacterium]|nr:Lrp/AsnC family transcriptional regulator [Planctomycetota bacterium]